MFFFLTVMGATKAFAQEVQVSGRVLSRTGDSIESGNVVVLDGDSTMVSVHPFRKGSFGFRANLPEVSGIRVSCLGYRTVTVRLDTVRAGKDTEVRLDVRMDEESIALEEVLVTGKPTYEPDTVRLDIDVGGIHEESSLADILKKIPNFRIDEDGSIVYKGKSIDRITINNKPGFEHQNDIALKSVRRKIIEGIDIVNNYRDGFDLTFEKRKESIMNIDIKEEFRNVLFGTAAGGYGHRDKFGAEAEAMSFSKAINAFFVSNTNNIGEPGIKKKGMVDLFRESRNYSNGLLASISDLFLADENRSNDFRSASNITVRRTGTKHRIGLVSYYIRATNTSVLLESLKGPKGAVLRERTGNMDYSGVGSFTKLNYARRFGEKTMLRYEGSLGLIRDESVFGQRIESAGLGTDVFRFGETGSNRYLCNDIDLKKMAGDSRIFGIGLLQYSEMGKVPESSIRSGPEGTVLWQCRDFGKHSYEIRGNAAFNVSRFFLPTLRLSAGTTRENIAGNGISLKREFANAFTGLRIRGKKILRYFDYDVDADISGYSFRNGSRSGRLFFAHDVKLGYENRLNYAQLYGSSDRSLFDLSSGLPEMPAKEGIVIGSAALPSIFTTNSKYGLSYHYNNLFKGETYGIKLKWNRSENRVDFVAESPADDGVLVYKRYAVPSVTAYGMALDASRMLFRYTYPVKVGAELDRSLNKGNYRYQKDTVAISGAENRAEIKLETLSRGRINFSNSAKLANNRITSAKSVTELYLFENLFEAKYHCADVDIGLSFIYQNNRLEGRNLSRKNINFNVSRKIGDLSVGMEAKNIDEILSLSDNSSYNTQLSVANGFTSALIRPRAMNYCVLKLKYSFKP